MQNKNQVPIFLYIALKPIFQRFLVGYSIQFLLNLIINKGQIIFQKCFSSGMFLAIQSLVSKVLQYLLKQSFNKGLLDFVVGFVSGFAGYRYMPYQFIFYQMISKLFEALLDLSYKKNIIKKRFIDQVVLMQVLVIITGYTFSNEPQFLNKSLYYVYNKFGTFTQNEMIFKSLWAKLKDKQFA